MRKKILRIFSVILTLCMAFNLFVVPALAAGTGTETEPWDISEVSGTDHVAAWYEGTEQDGYTVHITGTGRMTASFQNTAAPWADIKEHITKVVVDSGVTNVGAYAFNYCRRLTGVSLPEGLTEIGTYAFHATGVKRLTIPASVNTIGRMIATPNTYFEVLGDPQNVNDFAFSTSLVSAADQAAAEALNAKTNVLAVIVLDGGIYGTSDQDLVDLSYGLIQPVKEGFSFQGWYRDAGFTKPCNVSEDGRSVVNINHIYYARWGQGSSGGTGGGTSTPSVTTGKDTGDGAPTTTTIARPSATVKDGAASSTVSSGMGSEIVRQAEKNNSDSVVIAPEISGDVSRTEVTIPAATVGELGSKTEASLTVSTPVAEVTIPNEALGSLSQAGDVTVTAEQTGNTVELTVAAGGETVENIPGGVKVTVPVEAPTPGTVAVLVKEDGTREVIRKSVAGEDSVVAPLDGSAKIEIVDNGKQFSDVPAANWAADAVAFVSSRELFNGTSPTTFSPNSPMSRGMLAVVLHNLESNPKQALTGTFGDVDNSKWYAEGIAWAAEKGIITGYNSGKFGPDDDITREQLAVMLWRYAGSPAAEEGELSFHDGDKTSSWAMEAMRWATRNGIINGKGNGILDPGGKATRAQAAQMLKNFMENQ